MDADITKEILDDLIPAFEAMESQVTAIVHVLREKGVVRDDEFALSLEQAANASNVRWLGIRVRLERLLLSLEQPATALEQPAPAEEKEEKEKKRAGPEASRAGGEALKTKPDRATQPEQEGKSRDSEAHAEEQAPTAAGTGHKEKAQGTADEDQKNVQKPRAGQEAA